MAKPCYADMENAFSISPFSRHGGIIHAFSDSGWAGCQRTRKSTSGGVLFQGIWTNNALSSNQKAIALSSAEAELHVATRVISETKGFKSLGQDVGESLEIVAQVDAQAANGLNVGVASAKLGRALGVGVALAKLGAPGRGLARKVGGEDKPADTLSHPVLREALDVHFRDVDVTVYSRPKTWVPAKGV